MYQRQLFKQVISIKYPQGLRARSSHELISSSPLQDLGSGVVSTEPHSATGQQRENKFSKAELAALYHYDETCPSETLDYGSLLEMLMGASSH